MSHREEHKVRRREVEQEFQNLQKEYYDDNGRVYDLKPINKTHQVALEHVESEEK